MIRSVKNIREFVASKGIDIDYDRIWIDHKQGQDVIMAKSRHFKYPLIIAKTSQEELRWWMNRPESVHQQKAS